MKRIVLAVGTLVLLLLATTVLVSAQAPTAPAGLYVTDLQIAPSPPTVGNTFTFTASFLNTASGEQNMKWRVLIYLAAAAQRSYTDTSWLASTFPVGASAKLSDGDWYLPLGTPCDYYFARVVWMDSNNQSIPFTTPDGKVFEKGFTTCPALPTSAAVTTPATAAAPSAPTAPAGLYVTDLQIAPSPPTVGNTFTFTASFLNTASGEQNMKWRVLIYLAAAAQRSYTDTSWIAATFPVGASAKLSDGDWYLPLGTPCDYYFARVVWMDSNNQSIPFTTPAGKVFEKGFTTCPALPTSAAVTTPATAAAPSAPTAPAGLYVTDLQIAPSPPTVGNTFTFTASFLNTASGEQNMKWRVLIYLAAAAQRSYTDTSWIAAAFPVGASVKLSDGDWYLPLGTPCDYYFARVVWMDSNNQSIPFTTPAGKVFEKGFKTCP